MPKWVHDTERVTGTRRVSVGTVLIWLALAAGAVVLVGALGYLLGRRRAGGSPEPSDAASGPRGPLTAPRNGSDAPLHDALSSLAERRVRSMLTPRRELDWIDLDAPYEEQHDRLLRARHSRLPVGRGSVDRLLGVVHVRDLFATALREEGMDVGSCLREPLVVPESLPGRALMERFLERGESFAVALDEYGGVEGVVSVMDVAEALLGELPAVGGGPSPTVEREAGGAYLLDGKLYVEELKSLLRLASLPREDDRVYRTLGGLVVTLLGRIPEVDDALLLDGYRLQVVAMDGPRVGRVRASPAGPSDAAGSPPEG